MFPTGLNSIPGGAGVGAGTHWWGNAGWEEPVVAG